MLPEKTTVQIGADGLIVIKGPKGELSWRMPRGINLTEQGHELTLNITPDGQKEMWGTARSLIANMVTGVTDGYEKKLEIEGVGFKAQLQDNNLVLSVGFSHPVRMEIPEGVSLKIEKNLITVSGADKFLVGEVAANIRRVKKPEPYKGKGIHYVGEIIRRKSGKKATAGA